MQRHPFQQRIEHDGLTVLIARDLRRGDRFIPVGFNPKRSLSHAALKRKGKIAVPGSHVETMRALVHIEGAVIQLRRRQRHDPKAFGVDQPLTGLGIGHG